MLLSAPIMQGCRAGQAARQQPQRPAAVACRSAVQRAAVQCSSFGRRQQQQQQRRQVACRSASTSAGKLISRTEIPAFIPRADLMDQLVRWAVIEIQESGVANVGMPCKVRLAGWPCGSSCVWECSKPPHTWFDAGAGAATALWPRPHAAAQPASPEPCCPGRHAPRPGSIHSHAAPCRAGKFTIPQS